MTKFFSKAAGVNIEHEQALAAGTLHPEEVTMTGNEYREALKTLKLTQGGFGKWIGVHPVTAKEWARRGPPPAAAKWVEFLLLHERLHQLITPKE